MTENSPLRFAPLIKQIIWGGRRLGTVLDKPIGEASDYAESWEIVDHGLDQSVIQGGELDGKTLGHVFQDQTQWLMGENWTKQNPDAGSFPLLLKYLDCNNVLSVQVHPDDAYGATMSPPDLGKTEAWLILDSGPESVIYAGLKSGVDREQFAKLIENGETEKALHSFHPEPGDCVFIPAGTVHALGGGLLVAEIQQSSNTTFRLFDWNRTDANGKSRDLHIESSLEVTDFERGPVNPVRNPVGAGVEELVSCDKFELGPTTRHRNDRRRRRRVSFAIGHRRHCPIKLERRGRNPELGQQCPYASGDVRGACHDRERMCPPDVPACCVEGVKRHC